MAPRFQPPPTPLRPAIQWVVPVELDEAAARQTAFDRATLGTFRPADAGACVKVTQASAMWVPFWRTEVQVEGWRVDVGEESGGRFGSTTVVRYQGIEDRSTLSVCARRSFRDGIFGTRADVSPSGVVALEGRGEALLATAPIVDADVDWPEAEAWARRVAENGATNTDTVYSKTNAKTNAMQFVWVPVWWIEYAYRGEANPTGGTDFFVVFAAHDKTILHERHPSKVRAVMSRLRGVLSFDKAALDGSFFRKRREPKTP